MKLFAVTHRRQEAQGRALWGGGQGQAVSHSPCSADGTSAAGPPTPLWQLKHRQPHTQTCTAAQVLGHTSSPQTRPWPRSVPRDAAPHTRRWERGSPGAAIPLSPGPLVLEEVPLSAVGQRRHRHTQQRSALFVMAAAGRGSEGARSLTANGGVSCGLCIQRKIRQFSIKITPLEAGENAWRGLAVLHPAGYAGMVHPLLKTQRSRQPCAPGASSAGFFRSPGQDFGSGRSKEGCKMCLGNWKKLAHGEKPCNLNCSDFTQGEVSPALLCCP